MTHRGYRNVGGDNRLDSFRDYDRTLDDWSTAEINAEQTLTFHALTLTAQVWLGVKQGQELISPVMVDCERAE